MRALVLSGGGAKGSWQAGAMKALCEKKKYDYVIGTSVGSVNALGLSLLGADATCQMWREIKGTSDIMSMNFTWPWKMDGLFHFRPLRSFLERRISGAIAQFKSQNIAEHGVVAYSAALNLFTNQMEYTELGKELKQTLEAVSGSCAIAGIQSPTNMRVDGGHREIAPVRYAAVDLGCDEIDVILCSPERESVSLWKPFKVFPILSIAIRALEAMISEIGRTDLTEYPSKITVYAPRSELKISSLKYDPADISKAVSDGYFDIKERLGDKK